MSRRLIFSRPSSLSPSTTSLLNCVAIFVIVVQSTGAILLAPVHWNASNPTFKLSRNSLTIEVNLYDGIDFICPFYDNSTADTGANLHEYYIIYMVSRRSYDTCSLLGDDTTMILNCSTPRQLRRFTMFFEPFQAIPNAPEFHTGRSYYFVTTSTGRKDGLTNSDGGACYQHNMKLVISVCCQSSTPARSDVSSVPTTTTSLSSSSPLASRSSTDAHTGPGNRRTSLLLSPTSRSSTTTSVVIIDIDPSPSSHHSDGLRSVTARQFTTSTDPHLLDTSSQLHSLSSTRCVASRLICCLSLLLAFSCLHS